MEVKWLGTVLICLLSDTIKTLKSRKCWSLIYLKFEFIHNCYKNITIKVNNSISQNKLCTFIGKCIDNRLTLHMWQFGFDALFSHGQSSSQSLQNWNSIKQLKIFNKKIFTFIIIDFGNKVHVAWLPSYSSFLYAVKNIEFIT
jgi:hypothetical protein